MAVKPVLIDSNAYTAFKRSDPDAVAIVQNSVIRVSVIVLGELLHGFQLGSREQRNRDELSEFLASPWVSLVPVDQAVAERYAALKTQLRTLGKPIPMNDLWIAATAMAHGFDVYSLDAHMKVVPGLTVGTKLADFRDSRTG